MTDLSLLWRGMLLGFAIASPVGPIGVLCIRRTLTDGRLIGFISGLGAATADMLYGAVAAFGLTAVQRLLVAQQDWLQALGGLFLLFLGFRTFASVTREVNAPSTATRGRVSAYLTTLGLTLTNPATILSFTLVYAAFGIGGRVVSGALAPSMLVLGVFLGSAGWWLLLSAAVDRLRRRFNSAWMRRVNRAAGIVLAAFGAVALVGLWFGAGAAR